MNDNISVKSLIQSNYPTLHSAEKKVADYILNHSDAIVNYSVSELSDKSKASEATIVRTCKKIGYQGYYHLKIALAKEVINPDKGYPSETDFSDIASLATFLLKKQAEDLIQSAQFFDEKILKRVLTMISECDTLYFFGAGNSNPLAVYGAYKFGQFGIKTIVHVSPEMQLNAAYAMGKRDVAFGISNSGSTNLMLDIFNVVKQRGAKSVCVTNYIKSPLSKISTCQLTTAVSDKIFFEAFDSTRVPAMGMIDMLVLLFMHQDKTRYELYRSREEFLGSKFKG
ncbi:TPA: MurR/RpiR family transcriptional regulator [Klebsiella pneumoniae]|nr:MurR/RpiR family transcriptional regulator [Raoultella ornithinolytica]